MVNPETEDLEICPEETRNIPLSCCVNMPTEDYSVLSQFMRFTDGQTYRQTARALYRVRCALKQHFYI